MAAIYLCTVCLSFLISIRGGLGQEAANDPTIQCPPHFVPFMRSCYHAAKVKVTWPEAMMICETMNAELASISSAQEQQFIEGYLNTVKGTLDPSRFWLGATDIIQEGHWRWAITLDDLSYTNWSDQPDNSNGGENCLEMEEGRHWRWNDIECDETLYPLCEKTISY